MRVLYTIALAILLLGGAYAYTRLAANLDVTPEDYQVQVVQQTYSLEIERTFLAVPDSEIPSEATFPNLGKESVRVRFKEQTLLAKTESVPASERLSIETIPGVEQGLNEIFVFARQQTNSGNHLAAMRVRVFSQGRLIAESTFTNQPGSPIIYGTLLFQVHESN